MINNKEKLVGVTILFLLSFFMLFGCIQVYERHDIRADGSDYQEYEIYKSGIMANANCNSLKTMVRAYSTNITKEQMQNIENAPCRETETSIILYGVKLLKDNDKIKVIARDGKTYFRFEEKANPFVETTVKMPSQITDNNGEVVDSYTVRFPMGSVGLTEEKINYVEAEKPTNTCCLPLMIIGIIGITAFVMKTKHK